MEVSNDATLRFRSDNVRLAEQPSYSDQIMKDHNNDRSNPDNPGAIQMKEPLTVALQFLSTCSNETLLLVLVCLMGATYIILGRLGLLIIGIMLGIALHASWEGPNHFESSELRSSDRRQLSLTLVHRLLDWQNNKQIEDGQDHGDPGEYSAKGKLNKEFDLSLFGPASATALQSLIDAAVRDYVNYWYQSILPSEPTFPASCRRSISGFITSISSHLYRKRTTDIFLEFLTNSTSMVVVFLNEFSTAFAAAGPEAPADDAVLRYLEKNPDSSLSSLLSKQQQRKKLTMISDDILSRFLDCGLYDCIQLRDFLREILSGVVLESTISSMSRPEFINGWIEYLFSEGESDIMNAIDAGVEGAQTHDVAAAKVSKESTRPASTYTDDGVTKLEQPSTIPVPALSQTYQATEHAMVEANRLSAMITTQNLQEKPNDHGQLLEEESATEKVRGPRETIRGEPDESLSSPFPDSTAVVSKSISQEGLDGPASLLLYRASITVDDSLDSGDKAILRSKPTSSYLIQVEPHSGRSSGWMVFRKYTDFESIHETLGTISRLNQLRFGDSHPILSPWKGRTRQALAHDLERYLQDALQLEPLADSVTMRRFLEKDGSLGTEATDSSAKPAFAFPGQAAFENVGKGVMGVFSNAPKGVSGGGKAVIEGVTGVFGGVSNKKTLVSPGTRTGNSKVEGDPQPNALPRADVPNEVGVSRLSSDTKDSAISPELPGLGSIASPSKATSLTESSSTPLQTPESKEDNDVNDQLPSDFASGRSSPGSYNSPEMDRKSTEAPARHNQNSRLTADETRMAVELIFVVINELYSLSSAWNIRRTLLNAAKSYILRPNNPNLETIRLLLQESMIDSHTTDDAIGLYLGKLRESALPTAEELSAWPPPMPDAEKERQREAARRAFVQKGLPQAITSVMGAVASREALGKVFDSLQVEVVARGFVFSIILQALRAVVL
ncbi:PXA domain-containing protein [Aspergillus californicus]